MTDPKPKVAELNRSRRCKHCAQALDPRLDGDRDAHPRCALLQPVEPRAWEVLVPTSSGVGAPVGGPFATPEDGFEWLKREHPNFECAVLQLRGPPRARTEHAD